MMETFLTSNEWPWRLARTIVQGVLGVVVAKFTAVSPGLTGRRVRARATTADMLVLDPARQVGRG